MCVRWVPKIITDDHKTKGMGSELKFFTCYAQEGYEFLDSIVTGDETLLKASNSHCNGTIQIPPEPNIQNFSFSEKITASVFWDRKGILLVDFVPPGSTINAAAYCDTLTWLRRAIQNKRGVGCHRGLCLLQYNARPHSPHVTTALLEKLKWVILYHPPYSPELAPRNFYLFLRLKKHFAGKKFDDDDEVQEEAMTWFRADGRLL